MKTGVKRILLISLLAFSLAFTLGANGCEQEEEANTGPNTGQFINITVTADEPTTTTGAATKAGDATSSSERTIEITPSGFNPIELIIKAGDKVTFLNKDTSEHWPASAMHPTHTVYPRSGIEKCGTSEQEGIFDACKGLEQGEFFSFTFNEKGSWNYHDHVSSGKFGKIIVE